MTITKRGGFVKQEEHFRAGINGGSNLTWPDATCPGLNQDPHLRPLANNGGSTLTLALQANSPATHHCMMTYCPANDQRGWPG